MNGFVPKREQMTAEDDTTAQPDHATDRLSLTTLIVGISLKLLDFVGFVPDTYNGDSALLVLAILFGVCPIIFKVVALSVVWRYPLTAERQLQLRAEIRERQSA
ncbi:MAG: hypothetical protein ACPGQM_05900 [Alphaproteobacteria bacterium]